LCSMLCLASSSIVEGLSAMGRKRYDDLLGMKFSNLLVIKQAESSRTGCARWICRCELCGSETAIFASNLKNGRTKMCKSCSEKRKTTHGLSRDRIYTVWQAILRRCENPKNEHYHDYGGRGIAVCEEWHDLRTFAKWAYSNGFAPSAKRGECTIERRDVNGNYCPENCFWANMKTQGRNKRNNRLLQTSEGDKTITELSENAGILATTVSGRIKRGWSIEAALNIPVDKRRGGHRKPVLCVNDGKLYGSLIDAATAYELSYDKVRRAVDTDKDVDGYIFATNYEEGCQNGL